MKHHLRFALAGLLALAATTARAQTTSYNYANIADTAGPFESFSNYALSPTGAVSFRATLRGGGPAIYLGDGNNGGAPGSSPTPSAAGSPTSALPPPSTATATWASTSPCPTATTACFSATV